MYYTDGKEKNVHIRGNDKQKNKYQYNLTNNRESGIRHSFRRRFFPCASLALGQQNIFVWVSAYKKGMTSSTAFNQIRIENIEMGLSVFFLPEEIHKMSR